MSIFKEEMLRIQLDLKHQITTRMKEKLKSAVSTKFILKK